MYGKEDTDKGSGKGAPHGVFFPKVFPRGSDVVGRWGARGALVLVLWIVLEGAGFALSLEDLRHRGVVRVGMDDHPWGFFVKWQGDLPGGLCAEMARALAAFLGVREEIVAAPWGRGEPGSITGTWMGGDWSRFDLLVTPVTCLSERQERVIFSDPYITVGQMILVRRDAGFRTMESLRLGTIGAIQDSSSETAVREAFPEATLRSYGYAEDILERLRRGELDAAVVDSPVALELLRCFPDLTALEKLLTRERYALVLPLSADGGLVAAVNDFLRREGKSLVDRWSRGKGKP